MPTIPVISLPPANQWDQALLLDLLGGHLTPPGYDFVQTDSPPHELTNGAVVLVPGRYDGAEERVSKAIADLDWALVIVTGDEESTFDWRAVSHPNWRGWFMSPRPHLDYPDGSRFLGSGYAPWFRDNVGPIRDPSDPHPFLRVEWGYAGQVNHERRRALVDELGKLDTHVICVPTSGFTKGLSHTEYANLMAAAIVAPCPSGKHTPDTFRAFEALEAGAVPILDGRCPDYDPEGEFWPMIFGPGPWPFETIDDWSDVGKFIDGALADPDKPNECFAFWQLHKRTMGRWITEDLSHFGAHPSLSVDESITVVIPTSPIPSHPSTHIIDQTIESVRLRLPDAEIIVMIDGVRDEDADLTDDYREYQRRLLWKCNHAWRRVVPVRFADHLHQASMLRHTLEHVHTPMVLFVEHDTPLRPDLEIPWEGLAEHILSGDLNMIRLHHEAGVHPEHRHLMVGNRYTHGAVKLWRTLQFSARPHLASAAWYRQMLSVWFAPDARTMIEDRMYGVIDSARESEGSRRAWPLFRLALFAPDGDMRRTDHVDGREGRSKWEETFTW